MRPLISEDGTPLISADGTPLLGEPEDCPSCCAGFNGCVSCDCLDRNTNVTATLEVKSVPIRLAGEGATETDGCGYAESLAGLRSLSAWRGCQTGPLANNICGGCFVGDCLNNTPTIRGGAYAAPGLMPNDGNPWSIFPGNENDCGVHEFFWRARWFVGLNKVDHTLSVFLAFHWYGGVGCQSACRSHVVSYIRWEYRFQDCADISNPEHIRTMMWHGWGEGGENSSATAGEDATSNCLCSELGDTGHRDYIGSPGASIPQCSIHPDEWVAYEDAWVGTPCAVYLNESSIIPFPAAPPAGHYAISSLTPPVVRISGCENACCATEGGPPTAILEVVSQQGCMFSLQDASTPGTCGPITDRLWLLEQWDEDPEIEGNSACPSRQTVISSDDFGLDGTETAFLQASGCGGKWVRATLLIWDSSNCFDSASTGILTCCNCVDGSGNPCPTPSGGLIITELTDCQYRLTASASGDGTCGEGDPVVLWWPGSAECIDPEDAPCDDYPNFCPNSLLNGQHTDITINGCERIYWTTRAPTCGCLGPIQSQQICCKNCDCCEEAVRVFVTLSGFAQNGVNDCLCENINGTWELTKSSSGTAQPCVYELQPPGSWLNGSCNLGLEIELTIGCFEGELYGTLFVNGGNSIFLEGGLAGDDCTALPAAMTTSYAIPILCTTGTVSLSIVAA